MKKVTLDDISRELNVSKTTVSKAINDCPGIHACTKTKIMETVSRYGYSVSRPAGKIAVVLPASPSYFWGNLRKEISARAKKANISCTYYVYQNLYDGSGALGCVNQALLSGASVIISALPDTEEIVSTLESTANEKLIILLEQYLDIKNAFFIGENSYQKGYELGKEYIKTHPDYKSVSIIRTTNYKTENLRVDGFLKAINETGEKKVFDITVSTQSKNRASLIARELDRLNECVQCIFCPSGNSAEAVLAVKKLKAEQRIYCIGFDTNDKMLSNIQTEKLTVLAKQNITEFAKSSFEYAEKFVKDATFPNTKCKYIESLQ